MRFLKTLITLVSITIFSGSCILFKTVEIPEPPKPLPVSFFSLDYYYENSFYVTDHDSVKKVLERIFNENEIIFPRTPSFYLIPKLRLLFFRKNLISFDYYDRWAYMTYVEEDNYFYNKLDSLLNLNRNINQ